MQIYYTAPDYGFKETPNSKLFMAGGITGCPDWQAELSPKLVEHSLSLREPYLVLNPRREEWPDNRPEVVNQIKWEHQALKASEVILFWFPKETLCPITLFELGRWSYQSGKKVLVGSDPDYARREDLDIQLSLLETPVTVVDTLAQLYDQVVQEISTDLLEQGFCSGCNEKVDFKWSSKQFWNCTKCGCLVEAGPFND